MGVRIMEAATLPDEQEQDNGAPVEGAEATRSTAHLFQYSRYVHVGEGAEECEHREDGGCQNAEHFHAWIVLPNPLQHRDILEKARAAKSRRKRAMRDGGSENHIASDAYVNLEADLDDLLAGDVEKLMSEIADREVRRSGVKRVGEVQESDEKWENYWQDREEWERLGAMPEDERPTEYEQLDTEMREFEEAVEARSKTDHATEMSAMKSMSEAQFRERLRQVRIDGESSEAHLAAYYLWMAFIATRKPTREAKRYFPTIDDYRNAPPEVVEAIDFTIRDLEDRVQRGDAAGN